MANNTNLIGSAMGVQTSSIYTSPISVGTANTYNSVQQAASWYNTTFKSNSAIKTTGPHVMSIHSGDDTEIVHLTDNGKVVWKNGIDVDAAADALSKSLLFSAEKAVKITDNVKQRMRDTVFEEMIYIAKERGSITADELTLMWDSAKIIDKLKGGYNE